VTPIKYTSEFSRILNLTAEYFLLSALK